MARGLNNVYLIGCVNKQPELKYTPNGLAILEVNVAGNDDIIGNDGQPRSVAWYHRVSVFDKQAEYLVDQIKQGTAVFVTGRLNYRSWEDQQGVRRSALDISAIRLVPLTYGIRQDNATTLDSINQPRLNNALNQVTIIGNLTRDAELRYTPNGHAVVRFGVAVNEQYRDRQGQSQDKVHYVNIQAWRELAEGCGELKKGSPVAIIGRLINDSWQDQDGNKRFETRLESTRIEILARGSSSGGTETQPVQPTSSEVAQQPKQVDQMSQANTSLDIDEEFPPEEDLPF